MPARVKLWIKTYGCQMNVYDSARMAELLAPHGYTVTGDPAEADLAILNTCHIREKAGEKVYSEVGRLKPLKVKPGFTIVVAGCVAQAEGAEVMRRSDAVDIVVGPQAYHRLPELLARARARPVATDFPAESKFDVLPAGRAAQGPSAFLTVQEGCDKFCTFCVVPYTRGAEVSRPVAAIEAEARALAAAGAAEITLLGQNVNAFHGADEQGRPVGLAGLIARLARIEGVARLRYITSHPRDMDAALIGAHGGEAKLMPYLHLPVQSGSDKILDAMNRGHTVAQYLDLVARLKRARADLALTSDFIVGFPGESEADFAATLDLVRQVRFANAYAFKYSRRPGTPAAAAPDQVPEGEKESRLARLQAVLLEQQQEFNRAQIGRELPVLIEKAGRRPGQVIGRSPYLQAVHMPGGDDDIGRVIAARIVGVGPNSLAGARAGEARRIAS